MHEKDSSSPEDAASRLGEDFYRDLAEALQRRAGAVDCAYLFGSVARGEAGAMSDVDLAVLFPDSLPPESRAEIAAALAGELERIGGPAVDLTILNEAPPALQHRAIRDGRLVYVRDEARRVAFETRAIQEFLDFQPVLERYDRALWNRAREGRLGA